MPLLISALACANADPTGVVEQAITGGTLESGYSAVFSLAYEGQGGCTGTCVTPRVGTTAKHCIGTDPASSFSALFGDDETSPTQVIVVTAVATSPGDGDFGLVAFAEACPAVIPYNTTPLEGHEGEPVVMVGFGVTTEEANDAGVKRSGTATLYSVAPAEVPGLESGELATSNVPAGTCNGDSGGPTFMTFAGTQFMVGVTSRGSLRTATEEWPCGQGQSIAVRADSYAAFIQDFIDVHDPGAGSGGGGGGGGGDSGGGDTGGGDTGGDPDTGGGGGGGDMTGGGDSPRPTVVTGCEVGGRHGHGTGSLVLILSSLLALALAQRSRAASSTQACRSRC